MEPTFEADYTYQNGAPFKLASGACLETLTLRYAMYGKLSEDRDNAILVCHALSGSARVADWWSEVVGPNRLLDTSRYCILGTNIVGSCYGSTGPLSINPLSGQPYKAKFPLVTIEDMVVAQERLIEYLGIAKLHTVIGGSIGGMQALQWALSFPNQVERCVSIGATPLSAMGLALNHLQRLAIKNDERWQEGDYTPGEGPDGGLALARSIAMCSYKSSALFNDRYQRRPNRSGENPFQSLDGRFDVAGYLDYQGNMFTRRFDANTYLVLSKAMDTFEFPKIGESEAEAFARIRARLLLVGISSDWLFPAGDVRSLAARLRAVGVDANYAELDSFHGHDGFLADANRLAPIIETFMQT